MREKEDTVFFINHCIRSMCLHLKVIYQQENLGKELFDWQLRNIGVEKWTCTNYQKLWWDLHLPLFIKRKKRTYGKNRRIAIMNTDKTLLSIETCLSSQFEKRKGPSTSMIIFLKHPTSISIVLMNYHCLLLSWHCPWIINLCSFK